LFCARAAPPLTSRSENAKSQCDDFINASLGQHFLHRADPYLRPYNLKPTLSQALFSPPEIAV